MLTAPDWTPAEVAGTPQAAAGRGSGSMGAAPAGGPAAGTPRRLGAAGHRRGDRTAAAGGTGMAGSVALAAAADGDSTAADRTTAISCCKLSLVKVEAVTSIATSRMR